jgi:hypothetical protein
VVSSSPLVTAVLGLQAANASLGLVASDLSARVLATESLDGNSPLSTAVLGLQNYAPCCGRTNRTATDWKVYPSTINGSWVVQVDISSCGFTSPPIVTTSLGGSTGNWLTTGGTSIYPPATGTAATAFRIFLFPLSPSDTSTDTRRPVISSAYPLSDIQKWQWHINWCARRE